MNRVTNQPDLRLTSQRGRAPRAKLRALGGCDQQINLSDVGKDLGTGVVRQHGRNHVAARGSEVFGVGRSPHRTTINGPHHSHARSHSIVAATAGATEQIDAPQDHST